MIDLGEAFGGGDRGGRDRVGGGGIKSAKARGYLCVWVGNHLLSAHAFYARDTNADIQRRGIIPCQKGGRGGRGRGEIMRACHQNLPHLEIKRG